jgi:4-amino-4-deoxy-L-arabinose transferase-like glycosyltransferase
MSSGLELPGKNRETPLPTDASNTSSPDNSYQHTSIKVLIFCILGLLALIPRIILARQLDLVKDEIIYIIAGKSYMPLLRHITTSIGSGGWQYNYEHPPLVKLLMGLSILINAHIGHPLNELLAARIPSIIVGVALVIVIYWLGREPFGHVVAFLAALAVAFSPWLAYFSALAYLDMTMTTFITTAYLLTWHATRRPWLYIGVALLVGLGVDSKYTAALIIPAIILFTGYYFFVLRLRLPATQRPAIPWRWWLLAIILAPLCFLMTDPAIWPDPLHQLPYSMLYEWNQSIDGHLTFVAGSANLHVPHWAALYIIMMKVSATITIPAAFFVIFALVQLLRFHLRIGKIEMQTVAPLAFLLIWLVATFSMFSLLSIIVGTHYLLPLVPPVTIAGAYTLTMLVRYGMSKIRAMSRTHESVGTGLAPVRAGWQANAFGQGQALSLRLRLGQAIYFLPLLIVGIILVGPHLLGLITIP